MKTLKIAMAIAALFASGSAASAQQSAAAFVRGFYRDDGATGNWRNFLTADTARLQRAAEGHSRGEVPEFLDADPVCLCQDDASINVLSVRTAPARGGFVQASVRFEYIGDVPDPAHTVRFVLVRERRGWRIQDIIYPFGRRTVSYRYALQRAATR